jgi:hypothetical protein
VHTPNPNIYEISLCAEADVEEGGAIVFKGTMGGIV